MIASVALGPTTVEAACLPPGLVTPPAAVRTGATGYNVVLDGSLSMAGYVGATGASALPDLLRVIERTSRERSRPVRWYRFASKVTPLTPAQGMAHALPAAYQCPPRQPRCDNRVSRIDTVLQAVERTPATALSIVLTDLWLSGDALGGSPEVALGGPLTAMLRQGRAVGVVGLRAPYRGPVYDIPGQRPYSGARERPLFALMIGPQAEVSAMQAAFVRSGSPALAPERTRYALFSTAPVNPWRTAPQPVRAVGPGAQAGLAAPELTPGLQQFRFRPARGGRLEALVDVSRAPAPGAVWRGPLTGSTRVWRLADPRRFTACAPAQAGQVWRPVNPLAGAWRRVDGRPTAALFAMTPQGAAALPPGQTYLVAARLGPASLQSPNPAAAWMREWGFSAGQAASVVARKPAFFPTLGLGSLAGVMEAALNGASPPGGRTMAEFAYIVRIER